MIWGTLASAVRAPVLPRPCPTLLHSTFASPGTRALAHGPPPHPECDISQSNFVLHGHSPSKPQAVCPDLPGAGDSFHTTSAAQSERHSSDPVVTHSCGLDPDDALLTPPATSPLQTPNPVTDVSVLGFCPLMAEPTPELTRCSFLPGGLRERLAPQPCSIPHFCPPWTP